MADTQEPEEAPVAIPVKQRTPPAEDTPSITDDAKPAPADPKAALAAKPQKKKSATQKAAPRASRKSPNCKTRTKKHRTSC
jgi:hypothetical protein